MKNEQVIGDQQERPDKVSINNPLTHEIAEQNALFRLFSRSMFWKAERDSLSAWAEHVPFAFWLVDVLRRP